MQEQEATFEVRLELTLDEIHIVTCALADRAAHWLYLKGYDWEVQAEVLETVARAFRNAPEDEKAREAEDAYVQWRHAQE